MKRKTKMGEKMFVAKSEKEIDAIVKELLPDINRVKKIAFYGEMGAGKTTFISSLCKELGVKEPVSSPTFSIVNEYVTAEGEVIYHFDFYRIKSIEEAMDLGYEDYFYQKNYCFIEWSEKIEPLLPQNYIRISIFTEEENQRRIIAKEYRDVSTEI